MIRPTSAYCTNQLIMDVPGAKEAETFGTVLLWS